MEDNTYSAVVHLSSLSNKVLLNSIPHRLVALGVDTTGHMMILREGGLVGEGGVWETGEEVERVSVSHQIVLEDDGGGRFEVDGRAGSGWCWESEASSGRVAGLGWNVAGERRAPMATSV